MDATLGRAHVLWNPGLAVVGSNEKHSAMLANMAGPLWPSAKQTTGIPSLTVQQAVAILEHQGKAIERCLRTGEVCHSAERCIKEMHEDRLQLGVNMPGVHGLPVVESALLMGAQDVLTINKGTLEAFGYEQSVAGLVKMDAAILTLFDEPQVFKLIVRNLLYIISGVHTGKQADYGDTYIKWVVHFYWASWTRGMPSQSCVVYPFLYHLALPAVDRRTRSIPRTIAFMEMYLEAFQLERAKHFPKKDERYSQLMRRDMSSRLVVVIGAHDNSEGKLAREGYFEDAWALRSAGNMVVILVGEEPINVQRNDGEESEIRTATWEDFATGQIPTPNFFIAFHMQGLRTLEESQFRDQLPWLIGLMQWPCVPPVVISVTCSSEAEGRNLAALAFLLVGTTHLADTSGGLTRNYYSAMAGSPDVEFDENGWFVTFHMANWDRIQTLEYFKAQPDKCLESVKEMVKGIEEAKAKNGDKAINGKANETAKSESKADANSAKAKDAGGYGQALAAAKAYAAAEAAEGAAAEAAANKEAADKSPVVFWGILDLKYDPDAEPLHRVKVLETGDGKTSRFSGYGAKIKEAMLADNKLQNEISRALLADNKKLFHDVVSDLGYGHLLPTQKIYRKTYEEGLARDIRESLKLKADDDICVLKLCNRCRGAGVIPVKASSLDAVLKELLEPPEDLADWLEKQPADWTAKVEWGSFEEQKRHWWSNECPIFIVEEYSASKPIEKDGKLLDGTMRVGFALRRTNKTKLKPGWKVSTQGPIWCGDMNGADGASMHECPYTWEDDDDEKTPWLDVFRKGESALTLQWLGGYWKLPLEPMDSEDVRGRIVSVAKQGTAPVPEVQLREVYTSLQDMVTAVFDYQNLSHGSMLQRYDDPPEFGAFAVTRLATSLRAKNPAKARDMLRIAEAHAMKGSGIPKAVTLSYIRRNYGVDYIGQGKWTLATESIEQSLIDMPTNASSLFLRGMCCFELGKKADLAKAVEFMQHALLLDPDFKAAYVNIGCAQIRLANYEEAAKISTTGDKRFPTIAPILYNYGAAKFALAVLEVRKNGKPGILAMEAYSVLRRARDARAKDQAWSEFNKSMMDALEQTTLSKDLKLPTDGWRAGGWRP